MALVGGRRSRRSILCIAARKIKSGKSACRRGKLILSSRKRTPCSSLQADVLTKFSLQKAVQAKPDYKAVREAISDLLEVENYDDGMPALPWLGLE